MPHIRLTGLVLFITTVFLAMAAAATQTTHIRFKRPNRAMAAQTGSDQRLPDQDLSRQPPLVLPPGVDPPLPGRDGSQMLPESGASHLENSEDGDLRFVSVPVIYPLLIAAAVGLGLWFVPAPQTRDKTKRRRRRRR